MYDLIYKRYFYSFATWKQYHIQYKHMYQHTTTIVLIFIQHKAIITTTRVWAREVGTHVLTISIIIEAFINICNASVHQHITHMYVCVYTYIPTYIHTYIHTYIYICVCILYIMLKICREYWWATKHFLIKICHINNLWSKFSYLCEVITLYKILQKEKLFTYSCNPRMTASSKINLMLPRLSPCRCLYNI